MLKRSNGPAPQVRDQLTTTHEQALLRSGGQTSPTLSRNAVLVDAIVNTGAWVLLRGQPGRLRRNLGAGLPRDAPPHPKPSPRHL